MKMLIAILVIRTIISLLEKSNNTNEVTNSNNYRVYHPAEYQLR